jgi:thiamine-monophosphate kinase
LFTVSEDNKVGMETALANIGTKITCIGQTNKSKILSTTINNEVVPIQAKSFEHFNDK